MSSHDYSPRILIIEDDPLMGLLLKEVLESYRYTVDNPIGVIADAMDLLKTEHYDFVILDIKLHSYDGFTVAHYLLTKDIPFAFSTGYAQDSIPARYQHIPFFQKPYDMDLLHDLIQNAFQRAGREASLSSNAASLRNRAQLDVR
jgi:DNA-binding response OmpR family regulator